MLQASEPAPDVERVERQLGGRRVAAGGRHPGSEADRAGEVARRVGTEPHERARRGGDRARRAPRRRPRPRRPDGDDAGLPHGSPGRITARRGLGTETDARRGDDARAGTGRRPPARSPRSRPSGATSASLAQEVDHLLHVAHEVAAGHLLVLEDVGEIVALGPRVDRGRESGVGPARLAQPLVALGEAQVLPDPLDRDDALADDGSGQRRGGIGSSLSGPRRWYTKHDTTAVSDGDVEVVEQARCAATRPRRDRIRC